MDKIELLVCLNNYLRTVNKMMRNGNLFEEERVIAHNLILDKLNQMGIAFDNRWEALEIVREILETN